jgi:geranylgeranyl diphosphate synthase type I
MTIVPGSLFAPSCAVDVPDAGGPPAPDEIKALRVRVDGFMVEYLAGQRGQYVCHPAFATLYDDLAEFVCRSGKRLRPLLFLLSYAVFRRAEEAPSPLPESELLAVGASLEFLHGFILIHDDIIDRADTRRRLPSLHRVIEGRLPSFSDRQRTGGNLALVMGDVLFALAQKCLLETNLDPAMRTRLGALLLCCMVETGFGEAADIIHGTRDVSKVSLPEIEQMYLLKTTRYTIECPLAMAAMLAGAGAPELDALARIARPAGLAFQIQNDLQEFARFEVSDAEAPIDILEGKKTFLIRTAFALLNETDQGMLQLCFSNGTPTEATMSKARELIVKSGAVGRLTRTMEELFAEADAQVAQSGFCPAVQEGLTSLIRLVRGTAACA